MPMFARPSSRPPTSGDVVRRRPGWRSLVVALSAGVLVVLIPMLEVNDSHLFSPDWPAHARFHEAWQLLTNVGLALAALWLAVARGREQLAAGLSLIVAVSLVLAWVLGGFYGGDIARSEGGDPKVFGVSAPGLVMSMLAVALLAAAWPNRRRPMHS